MSTVASHVRGTGTARSAAVLLIPVLAAACAPPFADLQSARLAGPQRVEVTPAYSTVSFTDEGDTEKVQDHYGLQVATGVSDKVDLRARFEHVRVDEESVNVIGAGPKFGLLRDRVALFVPVGFAFGSGVEVSDTWQVHPTIIGTVPVVPDRLELNGSAKALIPIANSDAETLVAFNVGAGIGSLNSLVIRPEVGFLFNPGESGHFRHFTIGMTYYAGTRRQAAQQPY